MGCGPVKNDSTQTIHKKEPKEGQNMSEVISPSIVENATLCYTKKEVTTKEPEEAPPTKLKVEEPMEIESEVVHEKPKTVTTPVVVKEESKEAKVLKEIKKEEPRKEKPKKEELKKQEVKKEEPKSRQEPKVEQEQKLKQEPKFNPSAFKYTAKNPEFIEHIKKTISSYNPNESEAKLDAGGKEHYRKAISAYKMFEDLIDDPRWKEVNKSKDYISYDMKEGEYICSKLIGKIPISPIEVFLT